MTYNVFGGTLNLAQSNPVRLCVIFIFWLSGRNERSTGIGSDRIGLN